MKQEFVTIPRSFLNKILILWFYCGAILSFTIFSILQEYKLHISIFLVILTIVSLSVAIFNSITIQIDKPIKLPDIPKPSQISKPKKNFGFRSR